MVYEAPVSQVLCRYSRLCFHNVSARMFLMQYFKTILLHRSPGEEIMTYYDRKRTIWAQILKPGFKWRGKRTGGWI